MSNERKYENDAEYPLNMRQLWEKAVLAGGVVSYFKWYAIQVRPTKEGKVNLSLVAKGYECFLPVSRFRRRTAKGIAYVSRPCFPGYLFCRLDLRQNRMALLVTPDVLGLVSVGGVPAPLPDAEIASIRRVAASGMHVEAWPFSEPGSQVELLHGPLRGLRGVVVARSNSTHIVVSVELLQRSIAVEIPSDWAYPCQGSDALTAEEMPVSTFS